MYAFVKQGRKGKWRRTSYRVRGVQLLRGPRGGQAHQPSLRSVPGADRLRASQFSILAKLKTEGPLTINALAEDMVMDRTTLGRNILPLERDGLIGIERAAKDRRAKELHLTKAGDSASRRRERNGPRRRHDLKPHSEPNALRICAACCKPSRRANSSADHRLS